MSKKLNIAEMLKDCPQGMELDSTIINGLYFDKVTEGNMIKCYTKRYCESASTCNSIYFYSDGSYLNTPNAKCVIFPKDKTTWEGFQGPFKDGDVLVTANNALCIYKSIHKTYNYDYIDFYCGYRSSDNQFIIKKLYSSHFGPISEAKHATKEEKQKLFDAIKANGYKWNAETKTLEKLIVPWTIQDAKDGDVIFYDDGWTCIFKCIHGVWFSSYCFITGDGEFHTGYERHAVASTINGNARLATKEQCDLLFQKIKEAGFKWNSETKTLEKLIIPEFKVGNKVKNKDGYVIDIIEVDINNERYTYKTPIGAIGDISFNNQNNYELVPNKFDILSLKPFDKVLVRNNSSTNWHIQFFEKYNRQYGAKYPFVCICGNKYSQCIPYEGNEHLVDTATDCDEFYKTW